MASASQDRPAVADLRTSDQAVLALYLAIGWAAVLAGFGPHLMGHLTGAEPWPPAILHVHGVVMMAWLGLFSVQSLLPGAGHAGLHRRLGGAAALLAVAVVVVGVAASLTLTRLHARAGDPRALPFLYRDLMDVVRFSTFTGLALLWRRRPDRHRRLMMLSFLFVIVPGAARALGRSLDPIFASQAYLGASAHLFLAPDVLLLGLVAYEFATRRRLHAVYRFALPLLLADQALFPAVSHSTTWLAIARRLAFPLG